MKLALKRLGLVSLLSLACTVAPGCGSDEETAAAPSGTGGAGSGGAAGKAGAAGSAGSQAGKGGSAGSAAGTGGSAGAGAGGAGAGGAGAGGAGAGGAGAGGAGAGGAGAGGAGAGGSDAGAGGTAAGAGGTAAGAGGTAAGAGGSDAGAGGSDAGAGGSDAGAGGSDAGAGGSDAGAAGDAGAGGSDAGAGGAGAGGDSGAGGTAGAGPVPVLSGPSRGSPISLSPDDSRAVVVNRDAGTVSVLALDYSVDPPSPSKLVEIDMGDGSEPWQAVVHPDGKRAYVVLRNSRKLVEIVNLDGTPAKGAEVSVGSEPTAVALTPTGAGAWVANWVDGTLSRVDTATMTVTKTVDLNKALVDANLLGPVESRPALSHPRSIAITNNGDQSDDDETLVATEYYAIRVAADGADGSQGDTSKRGYLHVVSLANDAVTPVELDPFDDMGFPDHKGGVAGCFPNQLQSVTVNGDKAYVVSICASPEGPLGVFAGPSPTCTLPTDCPAPVGVVPACNAGVCSTQCAADAACGAVGGKCDLTTGKCQPNPTNVRTTTAPVVHVVDLPTKKVAAKTNLNAEFNKLYTDKNAPDDGTRRFPLVANDLAFVPGTGIAYLPANGTDAVFRVVYDPATGASTQVGAASNSFIDLHPAAIADANKGGRNPIGFVVTNQDHGGKKFGLSANDASRDVSIVDFNTQAVAGGANPLFIASSELPAPGSNEDHVRRGKRFFNTGLGRWSLRGQGWGACQSCHIDGLSDNVTWYFARGPRQSTSLDGSFSKKDPNDQRLFNWSAIFDEVADFEGNTRGVSGGVGAIVKANNSPATAADRIDPAAVLKGGTPQNHNGLNGSAEDLADKANPLGVDTPSVLEDWAEITAYIKTIRPPQAPSNLDPALVATGRSLFQGANCQGCHGGDKWTVSRVFYDPSVTTNTQLKTATWTAPANIPASVLPSTVPANQLMRAGNAANDQILCILRNVGTFGASEQDLGVAELRADMITPGQGNATDAKGYNPPSLLGLSVGAPFFHNGGARTLEATLTTTFANHHRALAENFLLDDATGAKRKALIQFLLSIDASTAAFPIPASGGSDPGGNFCKP